MSTTSTALRAGSIVSGSGRAGIDVRLIRKPSGVDRKRGDDDLGRVPSKRVFAEDFPVIALAESVAFVVVHRAGGLLQELLHVATSGGRGVQKQDAAGFAARALPGVRDVAREERAGAWATDGHLVADLEGDLAGEHPVDLVAVTVQMEEALGPDGHGFLEEHDALIGLVAEQLQGGEAAGRHHVEMLPAARGYDEAFGCAHVGILPRGDRG